VNPRYFFASLTRIADLHERELEVVPVGRERWANGDYVVGEVSNHSTVPIELASGRMAEVFRGDLVVGALGRRRATLEAVGSWESIGDDGVMHSLTGAGLFGRIESISRAMPPLVAMRYRGHVRVDDRCARMDDYVTLRRGPERIPPVVLVVGTSMSAGKTTTARLVVRRLKMAGRRVAAAKLTGAGRYRDVLSLRDAGADTIFDFVDVGLPSTVCPAEEYRRRLRSLLSSIVEQKPDVIVAEAGASPLEPYNGRTVLNELGGSICTLVLAAADPYAVVGVREAFGMEPDLVTGLATSTVAGRELIDRLTGLPTLNVLDAEARRSLDRLLRDCLETA